MTIEARNRLLPDWLTHLRTRQTVLPRFQRYEAWSHSSVAELFNTILQDLPIGAVLTLQIGNEEPFISRPLKGAPEKGEHVAEHLLDGQQRLTALWRGLNNNYEDRTYYLALRKNAENELPYVVDSVARSRKAGETKVRPYWADEPVAQWERKMVPLDLCAPDVGSHTRYDEWASKAILDPEERVTVARQIAEVRNKFSTFNLPFLSLPASTPKDVALGVFVKMNTSTVALTIFDIVVAQLEAAIGQSLHDLVSDLRKKVPIERYYCPEDLVLYASALLQDKVPGNATYLNKDFGSGLIGKWKTFLEGARSAYSFLDEEGILDARRLPTDVVIPVLTALWAIAPKVLDANGHARVIMRKYIWRAFFTQRYERSTTTRAYSDFIALKSMIQGNSHSQPPIFDDHQYPLPLEEELAIAGWPKKKDRLARAVLAISLKQGGRDFADGGKVNRNNLAEREYHHLFPVAYLTKNGVADDRIFSALNCALVTWNTNRNISDKEPGEYLAERLFGINVGEDEIRDRLATHLISYDDLSAGKYDSFLIRRAKVVHDAMVKMCTMASQ